MNVDGDPNTDDQDQRNRPSDRVCHQLGRNAFDFLKCLLGNFAGLYFLLFDPPSAIMGSTAIFGPSSVTRGSKVSTAGSSAAAEDIYAEGASGASVVCAALEVITSFGASNPEPSGEDTIGSPPPTPAAAAAAFGMASLDAGLASTDGFASTLGGAGAASFCSTGLATTGLASAATTGRAAVAAGFAATGAANFACATGFALGTAGLLGASAFFAAGLDSLHFSRSSSNSRPLW